MPTACSRPREVLATFSVDNKTHVPVGGGGGGGGGGYRLTRIHAGFYRLMSISWLPGPIGSKVSGSLCTRSSAAFCWVGFGNRRH